MLDTRDKGVDKGEIISSVSLSNSHSKPSPTTFEGAGGGAILPETGSGSLVIDGLISVILKLARDLRKRRGLTNTPFSLSFSHAFSAIAVEGRGMSLRRVSGLGAMGEVNGGLCKWRGVGVSTRRLLLSSKSISSIIELDMVS